MIGFLATTDVVPKAVQLIGLIIFTILVAFHGVLFFLLHTLRSKEIQSQCSHLYHIITCRKTTHHTSGYLSTSSQQDTPRHLSIGSISGTWQTEQSSIRHMSSVSVRSALVSSDDTTFQPQFPTLVMVPEEEEEEEEEEIQRLSTQPVSEVRGRGSLVLPNMALTEEIEHEELEVRGRSSPVAMLTGELAYEELEAGGWGSMVLANLATLTEDETAAVVQDEGGRNR